jgi:hypothetical protein
MHPVRLFVPRGPSVFPLWREIHGNSVRACLRSRFTDLVHEARLASCAGGVVIRTVVWRCSDHNSIAVDVDGWRRGPPPLQTRRIYTVHLLALGCELNA